jgi:hypothetical protein
LVVLAVLVVSAAVAALLGRTSPRPDVQVADPFTDAWHRAVAAPAGPLAERWSLASPTDHELVGMAIVDDILAVASRPRLPLFWQQ